MAQPFVHGPVLIFAGDGSGNPLFIGTGEKAPRYSIRRFFDKVMNDISGSVIPYDYLFEGVEAFVTVRLTKWDEANLQIIQDVIAHAGAPGTMPAGDLGTLMMTEGVGKPLWIQYTYGPGQPFAKAAMGTMIPGYHAPCAFLEGPDDRDGGTDAAGVLLTWHCIRQYEGNGVFTLFDQNLAGLSPDNPP